MIRGEASTPVLVGAGQITAREPDDARTPIDLIAEAARAAAADCGVAGVLGQVRSLSCLNILAPAYPDAPASLARRLGIDPGERFYTPIGGNMGPPPASALCAATRAVISTSAPSTPPCRAGRRMLPIRGSR